ncbi:MAG: PAS domain-containing protein [Gemmatimonadales bacterium]|nr:MAG: PAS domain-containing protein [Gemmatimonadales bacterium]
MTESESETNPQPPKADMVEAPQDPPDGSEVPTEASESEGRVPAAVPPTGDQKCPQDDEFFVVGVGASAGGLEALGKFFEGMPPDCGMAFVVIQHLSPDHRSFMVELLSRQTRLPVHRAEDGTRVEEGHIYLIPPRTNLKVHQGRLLHVPPDSSRGVNLAIDIFFRSLAEDVGGRAVGVVLSGTGSDGTMGIRAIKEVGGLVMVQSEGSAQFDGMPRSAIATGLADFVLPPEEMPEQLLRFVRHPFAARQELIQREEGSTDVTMRRLFLRLRERTGVDFSFYKASTIDRRVARRISVNQLHSLKEYESFVQRFPEELDQLFNEFLIGVTNFFRDPESWETLAQEVVPGILARGSEKEAVRVWVPACATGEEAYSIAMLLADAMRRTGRRREVTIFGTDISSTFIHTASQGFYTESEVTNIPVSKLNTYFTATQGGYRVTRSLREMVTFAQHNVLKDPPFTRIDLISCRNALIYFSQPLQSRVLAMFHYALRKDGILFLGSSESLGEQTSRFSGISLKHRIFQARSGVTLPRTLAPPLQGGPRTPLPTTGPAAESAAADRSQALHRLETIYREIISDYSPACIVVNHRNEVVHLFGGATEYLRFREGSVSNDLLRLTQHNIAPALRTALHRVDREGGEFTLDNVRIRDGDMVRTVRIRIRDVGREKIDGPALRLVFIEERERETHDPASVEEYDPEEASPALARRLAETEQELVYTKESLQATVEELETSNEELQSSNEELLATNEELQSTNEELQSVNEELQTVNSESQYRIEELNELTNDINNLFASSSVGTLLLDQDLRIRKLSASLERLIPVKEGDVGVPIELLARHLHEPDLPDMARSVLLREEGGEVVSDQPDGRVFLLRMMPYRTETGLIEGMVLTVIDITERRRAEEREARQSRLIRGVMDAIPANVAVLDPEGVIIAVNQPWMDFAARNSLDGVGSIPSGGVGVGTNYFGVCRESDGERSREAGTCLSGFRSVLEGERDSFSLEYPCHSPGEYRWFVVTATSLPDRSGLVIAHFDVTTRRQAEAALGSLLALVRDPSSLVGTTDGEGRITSMSGPTGDVLGVSPAGMVGMDYFDLIPPERMNMEQELLTLAGQGKGSGPIETRRARVNGSTPESSTPCTLWLAPMIHPDGHRDGVIFVLVPETTGTGEQD